MTRTIDALEKTKIKIEINNPKSLESDPGSQVFTETVSYENKIITTENFILEEENNIENNDIETNLVNNTKSDIKRSVENNVENNIENNFIEVDNELLNIEKNNQNVAVNILGMIDQKVEEKIPNNIDVRAISTDIVQSRSDSSSSGSRRSSNGGNRGRNKQENSEKEHINENMIKNSSDKDDNNLLSNNIQIIDNIDENKISNNFDRIEETWERIILAEIFRKNLEKNGDNMITLKSIDISNIEKVNESREENMNEVKNNFQSTVSVGEIYVNFINENFAAKKSKL